MSKFRHTPITPASVIFKDKQLLTNRPEDMPYEDYRILRKMQNEVIKKLYPKNVKIR